MSGLKDVGLKDVSLKDVVVPYYRVMVMVQTSLNQLVQWLY